MKMKGLYITEIMLVMAILGILGAVALSSYQDHVFLNDPSHPERLEKYNKYKEEQMEIKYYGHTSKHDCP